jgi:4-hydroxybenzoyl-CoA thioesterase
VHWGDTDPAKIVFYPNYFVWFDESTRLFWDSVGLDWDSLGKRYGVAGLPIVEAKAKFLSPSKFRDEIIVESQITEWNDKTFKISHAILNKGQRAVEGYEIRVWAVPHPDDPGRLKAVPIPAEIRAVPAWTVDTNATSWTPIRTTSMSDVMRETRPPTWARAKKLIGMRSRWA